MKVLAVVGIFLAGMACSMCLFIFVLQPMRDNSIEEINGRLIKENHELLTEAWIYRRAVWLVDKSKK